MSRRPRKTVGSGQSNPAVGGAAGGPRLSPSTDTIGVGDSTAAPSPKTRAKRPADERVAFGTYLPPDLKREFKATCAALGVEMQDATEQAIRAWMKEHAS